MRKTVFLIGVASLLLAVTAPPVIPAAANTPTLQTHPCQLPNLTRAVVCGALSVPEDPEHPNGRAVSIHFAIVKASSGRSLPDPIVVLMGGPGEGAIAAADFYTDEFKTLLDDRDLLLFDQRLSGQSAPARCHLYSPESTADNLRDLFPPAAVKGCKTLLQPVADLKRYTFPYIARDLEDVRVALGYGPLNLFSGSYGTRAAQAFVRQYPRSVRTNYLGSPIPVDANNPLAFAKTEDTVLDLTFENCEKDTACHSAFPNVRHEFAQIVARLDQGIVTVAVPGSPESVTLARGRVVEWIRSRLYRPQDAAALPWIIHQAHEGDWSSVVDGILSGSRGADEELSWGLFLSVTCNEDLSFLTQSSIVAETNGTFLGDYRIRQQQAACHVWPKASLKTEYHKPIHSDVPTLIVTGDLDGGTPLSFAERVGSEFTHHVTVVAGGQGHTEWSDCLAELFARLVRTGSVEALQRASCPRIPVPPFKV